MADDTPRVEVGGKRLEHGQVLLPIPRHIAYTRKPTELADMYVPIMLATAKEHGGTLVGTPEILTYDEIRPRMADAGRELRDLVEDNPRSVFVLATMVPHDWDGFDRGQVGRIEVVGKPKRHPLDPANAP